MSQIQVLPNEQLYQILLPLSQEDILAFCQTTKQFSQICYDQYFWRLKYEQDYGPADFVALTQEFPELLPGNWRRAYHCRNLTQKYGRLYFGYYQDIDMIRRELEAGTINEDDLTYETLELLGRWNRQQVFQDLWDEEIGEVDWSVPNPEYLSFEETREFINQILDDRIKRHDERIRQRPFNRTELIKGINFDQVTPDSNVDVVASLSSYDLKAQVPVDIQATPRIIRIVVSTYDDMFKHIIKENRNPRLLVDFPSFEYTYSILLITGLLYGNLFSAFAMPYRSICM